MEYEWDDSSPVVISANNSIQSASFQNSSFQRRGNNRGRFNRSDGGGGGDGRGGGRGRFNNRRMGNGNSFNNPGRSGDAKIIKIPSKFVGRVIGKGGSKINDLQFESGAKIIVTKDQEENETMVKLIGTDDEVTKAEGLIRELTVERDYNSQNQAPFNFVYEESPDDARPAIPLIDWKAAAEASEKYLKAKWAKLPPIIKNFYVELDEVANMPRSEVEQFRKDNNNIVVSRTFEHAESNAKPIPNPVKTFYQAFHNYPEILDEIVKVGFETPSPIQAQAWPILLGGEDLIGIAQTGTGKTLAFLLPALIHIDGQTIPKEERAGPSVLVMAPTRELALQIDREVNKYSYKDIKAVCVYGGGSRKEQVNIVTKGVDIVIATPGRLNDLVEAGYIKVESITYVVLDEADRMLDMGFEPQIRKTMYDIRPDRQTVMTSATWPVGVRRLAQSYMVNPVQIHVGSLDLAAVHSVTQTIIMMSDDEEEKFNTFMEFVHSLQPDQKIIAFCGKKARASHLASELILLGIDCASIHGDLEQCDREQALVDIANGSVQILIATDVASRGIDIEDITHVINYDFPRNIEEYVHRVGRTGRAGRTGDSISYFTRGDWSQAKELIEILEEANQYVPEELVDMSERYSAWKKRKEEGRAFANSDRPSRGRGGGGGGRRW